MSIETRWSGAPKLQLPKFLEGSDAIDAYITRFKKFATNQGWPETEWETILSALHIFSTLSGDQQNDYDRLKDTLLKGHDLTEEGFRRTFRQARIQSGETYAQFGVRLSQYFNKWIKLSELVLVISIS